ncbi:phage major capsid protein [Altericroceibacterium spongiae]|uniref:Phage major capsid protein n=1 Tax=Altericroceibacterium spongiae TaxID=2320269 RepID=A0A420ERV9_9SPHN|nr:phage major capsid protein [Altericroceibacterium spongiae]RKF23370.1 phage major capsid protein [Altericroceibacterium spongiae]
MNMMTRGREFGRKEEGGQEPRDEKTIQQELKDTLDKVKGFAENFEKKAKEGEDVSREAKNNADEALTKLTELRGEMTELAQKLDQRGGGDDEMEHKSLGQKVGASDEFKSYLDSGCTGTMRLEVKAVTSDPASAGPLIQPARQPGIVELPRQRPRIRDLLTPGRTTSNSVEYAKQVTRTNNADVVAEGAQKPESDYAWEVDSAPVRTIAHWVPASRQAMDDIPQLESLIDGELRYGLDDAEDAELLLGDGTGQHLEGLYTVASAYADPIGYADPTRIDQLRLAVLQVELADYAPDGMVLHPSAWTSIELTKTTDGAYVFANPLGIAGPVLWGRPVVPTKRIGSGNFMVGAFRMAGQIFDRMETEVRISDQDRDNFIKNMLTVRAEKRLALAIRRPAALVKGALVDLPAAA